jgi:uncharacterized membrane protein HdeD (DUF308 family)
MEATPMSNDISTKPKRSWLARYGAFRLAADLVTLALIFLAPDVFGSAVGGALAAAGAFILVHVFKVPVPA